MSTENNLKPCPFCGSDAVLVETLFGGWTVWCETINCRCWDYGCGSRCYATKDKAIAAWNRRVAT